jgi:hypothetical protein
MFQRFRLTEQLIISGVFPIGWKGIAQKEKLRPVIGAARLPTSAKEIATIGLDAGLSDFGE